MIKRLLDFVLALILLFVLSPLLLIVGSSVWLFLGSPVIFRHERPGHNGALFKLYKFRSMSNQKGLDGELLPDEQRISGFGRILRSTSVDELPSLANVLKGDMSFVGPRPLLMEYLPLYTPEQRRRHEVRPGITGWAQVNGRNALSWEEKFALDVWYVDNQSMLLDFKILLMTVAKVLKREDISQEGQATMEKFTGTKL